MHHTQQVIEQARWKREDSAYASRPATHDQSHYWFIERKARRGWIFARDFIGTKKEIAKLWRKRYRGREPRYRLVHKMAYTS
jgi:hypothetical protein